MSQSATLLYRNDPIFSRFFQYNDYYKVLFETAPQLCKSFNLGSRLTAQWADGISIEQLQTLKRNRQMVITNCVLDASDFAQQFYTVGPEYYGYLYTPYTQSVHTPTVKNLACFINRFDIFRQSWFYHLVRQDWLDQSWVSFNCDTDASRVPDRSYIGLSPQQVFDKSFKENNSIFAVEHAKIRDQIPYKNFNDNGDLTPWILSAKVNLVLEVWFHGNHCRTFTEKTMRSLQLPRPWVLFASARSVQLLRSWGFDVLDDIVDHGYDLEQDHVQRQLKIIETLRELMQLDIAKHASRLSEASAHNTDLLCQWHQQWFINMEQAYSAAADKIINNDQNCRSSHRV